MCLRGHHSVPNGLDHIQFASLSSHLPARRPRASPNPRSLVFLSCKNRGSIKEHRDSHKTAATTPSWQIWGAQARPEPQLRHLLILWPWVFEPIFHNRFQLFSLQKWGSQ